MACARGPTHVLGPFLFPGMWDCFRCLSWGLARSRLWQQSSGVFLGPGTVLQVLEGKCLSHTGSQSISTDWDGDKTMQRRMSPKSPGMRPWSSISLCKAHRDPLCA